MTASPLGRLDPRPFFSTKIVSSNEGRAGAAGILNLLTMALEVGGGFFLHSAALLAEGFHMGAHVVALFVAGIGYRIAAASRSRWGEEAAHRTNDAAAFINAAILLGIAGLLLAESLAHMARPEPILFLPGVGLAVLGLAVNLLSLALLHQGPQESCAPSRDLNLQAIYLHMVGDFAVGVLSVLGLGLAAGLRWLWADGAAGVCGAILIAGLAVQILTALTPSKRTNYRSPPGRL